MNKTYAVLAALVLGAGMASVDATAPAGISGTYVEARTAEVFAGGCVINSEAGTAGREALLAWRVDSGTIDGVSLDGLAIVAAVSGDTNLGIHEIGGDVATTRAAIYVDARASDRQRQALVDMARTLAGQTIGTIVEEVAVPIHFAEDAGTVDVATPAVRLSVNKVMEHDPTCGNKQWFQPLASVHHADIGVAEENAFRGAALGTRWSDPDKRSAFFGAFTF